MTDSLSARLEEHEPCRMCEGRRGVNEAQSEGVYVGLKCPKCYGFGSEWIVDFISDAIGNSMGPDWNTRLGAQYVADMLSDLGFAQFLSERSTLIAGMEEARGLLNDAPEPYEYMSKVAFKSLPTQMRAFVDSHKTWMAKTRAYLTKEPNNGR